LTHGLQPRETRGRENFTEDNDEKDPYFDSYGHGIGSDFGVRAEQEQAGGGPEEARRNGNCQHGWNYEDHLHPQEKETSQEACREQHREEGQLEQEVAFSTIHPDAGRLLPEPARSSFRPYEARSPEAS